MDPDLSVPILKASELKSQEPNLIALALSKY
jgi:hypothetical protein